MAALTPTTIRGLIVPDPRITSSNLWAAESNYTEAGPIPGTAAAQQATEMALHTSGSQSSGTVEVRTLRGGTAPAAGFAWKASTDAATEWRGWDPPGITTDFRTALYTALGTVDGRRHPHSVALPSGKVITSFCLNDGADSKVYAASRSAAGVWDGTPDVVDTETSSGSYERHSALVLLPSGRLVCFAITYATSTWNVSSYYSDDDGGTWTELAPIAAAGPGAPATYTPKCLRAAYNGGSIVLLVAWDNAGDGSVRQYVSIDLGSSFSVVDTYTPAVGDTTNSVDIAPLRDGGFLATVWRADTSADDFWVYSGYVGSGHGSIPDQWETDTATSRKTIASNTSGTTRQDGWASLATADDGRVYAVLLWANNDNTVSARGETWLSEDAGGSWVAVGATTADTATWFVSEADAAYPANIHAVWHQGRVLVLHNANARAGLPTNGNSLYETTLGGYSSVTWPASSTRSDAWSDVASFARTWPAIEDPAAHDYTLSSAGAPTTAFDGTTSSWEITAAASGGDYAVYTDTVSITPSSGYVMHFIFRRDAGICHAGMEVDIGGGENNKVLITLGSDYITLLDLNNIANFERTAVSTATWYEAMLWYKNGEAKAWFRAVDDKGDRKWATVGDGAITLTDTVAASTDTIYFGIPAVVVVDTESFWRLVQHGTTGSGFLGTTAGINYADGFTNPTQLRARPYSTLPVGLPVTGNVELFIAARGGSTAAGDEWDIATEHRYSVDHIHPREYPSPSVGWRATTDTDSMTIAWRTTDETTGTNESDLWALYIDGTNIPQLKIQYTTSTTPGWTDWTGANLLMEFAGTRTGSTVQPINTGTAYPDRYIERDELVGGSVKLSSGDVRRIIRNDAGYLTSGSTIQNRVRIYLDEDDLDATDGTSGTFELRFPRALIVFNSPFATSQGPVVGLRLIINTATRDGAPENYWKIGTFCLGPMTVWGTQYSEGRVMNMEANVDTSESASGRIRSRVRGPPRLTIDFDWLEGVDLTWISGTTQDDYILPAASKEPVASKHDAPKLLSGLFREIQGEHTPVTYVPSVTSGSAGTTAYLTGRAGGAVFGRFVGGIEVAALLGDEEESELQRARARFRSES